MAANNSSSHSDNSWEELSVPPEIKLGTSPSVGPLEQESISMGPVEIADEDINAKMKVTKISSCVMENVR